MGNWKKVSLRLIKNMKSPFKVDCNTKDSVFVLDLIRVMYPSRLAKLITGCQPHPLPAQKPFALKTAIVTRIWMVQQF